LTNPLKVLLVEHDDILRMTIQIWLYRTHYAVTHALKNPDILDNILDTNHFDLVIVRVEGSGFGIEKLLLILLKHNAKILLMSSENRQIKKWKLANNIIQVIKTPFDYQSFSTTLYQLFHPNQANYQIN
jgi:DNA-binding response OmpR family regulator